MLNEFGNSNRGDYDEPTPTGRVFIVMHSNVTLMPHTYVKKHKTLDNWMDINEFREDPTKCWAFSKQGAKKIIERYKTRTYKDNYEKGLITFETIDEYSF